MSNVEAVSSLHRSTDLIERYAKCVLKDSKNPSETAKLKELEPYILFLTNAIESNQAQEKIFNEFVNMIDSSQEQLDPEKVLQEFSEQVKSVKKLKMKSKKCEKYVNFMNLLSDTNLNDDEIQAVSEAVNSIDPISKLPIVEPVKNKKCGHVYDKSTIEEFLQKYPKTKCPIAGCSATDFIKKTDLVPE